MAPKSCTLVEASFVLLFRFEDPLYVVFRIVDHSIPWYDFRKSSLEETNKAQHLTQFLRIRASLISARIVDSVDSFSNTSPFSVQRICWATPCQIIASVPEMTRQPFL